MKQLGVNSTFWYQLACFLISYVAFTQLILKPYMQALKEREKRTVGNEEMALKLTEQTGDLTAEYEKKARAINAEMKGQYDQNRSEAMKEYERLVHAAREDVAKKLTVSRAHIAKEIQSARQALSAEVPNVSATIASKLAGKEISL